MSPLKGVKTMLQTLPVMVCSRDERGGGSLGPWNPKKDPPKETNIFNTAFRVLEDSGLRV